MKPFISVDAEFRKQWASYESDDSLDRYLSDINEAVRRLKMAFIARNGSAERMEEIFKSITLYMLPSMLPEVK